MKLRSLHINSFGHFADYDLQFPSEGLQVIYGPNEAGKTTLLEFLRGWLFDFPVRTPYDFKAGAEISGSGTLVLSDGRLVDLRRRKGNKNKIGVKIDGRETEIGDVGFQQLIGHANQSLFESVFSFGLEQLSRGKESLKHESLQSALFGGGLGSAASVEQILLDLDSQAKEIFDTSPRRNTSVKTILGQMKELSQQVKAHTLKSDDYLKSQRSAADAEERALDLRQRLNQLRVDCSRNDKLLLAQRRWNELRARKAERLPLTVPAGLPLDAGARYAQVIEKLRAGADEVERLAAAIQTLQAELSELKLDPNTISVRAEIREILELRQSYLEASRDLPKLKLEHAALRQQISRELHDLRPGWGVDDLTAFSIDLATRSEIDRLFEESRRRTAAQTEWRVKREQIRSQWTQSRIELESLGPIQDATVLASVLMDEAAYIGDCQELEKRATEAAKIGRQLAERIKKLAPLIASDRRDLRELPVPRKESVTPFQNEFADLSEQLRSIEDSIRDDERDELDLLDTYDRSHLNESVPSLLEQTAARHRRDAHWAVIRERLRNPGAPVRGEANLELLGDAYEQSVRDADRLADQIYTNADAVARREEILRQIESLKKRIELKRERVRELQLRKSEWRVQWCSLWTGCGFKPLAPDVMIRWLDDYESAREGILRHEENQAEMDRLLDRKKRFEDRLRQVCAGSHSDPAALLAAAHQAVDDAREAQRRSKELARDINRCAAQLNDCDTEIEALNAAQQIWQSQWESLLVQLQLPLNWETELARNVIDRLATTRVKLESLPQEELRLRAMQSRLDEFKSRLRPLCESLAPDLLREPPELVAEKLSERLDRAAEADRQNTHLCRQLKALTSQQQVAEQRLHRLAAERTALFEAAATTSEEQFLEVVRRADRIRQLDVEIERLTRDLDEIRDEDNLEEFERSLRELDFETRQARQVELVQSMQLVEQQSREADRAAAVAQSELARLDGSAAAAMLTEELARKRSQVAAEIDRYIPLVFARHLLSEAVRRFDRDNQPEMIRTVSSLIERMTGGRYVEFDRTTDNSHGILVRRSDGVERTPEQLSTGTREQLYLAIRLAYVLHYCRQNEPLPIVMDDVLVNFDEGRVRQTLSALAEVAQTVQILFFTCHRHMVQLAQDCVPGLKPIELPATTIASGA